MRTYSLRAKAVAGWWMHQGSNLGPVDEEDRRRHAGAGGSRRARARDGLVDLPDLLLCEHGWTGSPLRLELVCKLRVALGELKMDVANVITWCLMGRGSLGFRPYAALPITSSSITASPVSLLLLLWAAANFPLPLGVDKIQNLS